MTTATHIAVLGAAESGLGAALLAKAKGLSVFVSDVSRIAENYRFELEQAGVEFEEGGHSADKILSADLIVKSPGIPEQVPIVQQAIKQEIAVVSEIEFAYHYAQRPIIGITGSNGKTTTTLLTAHLMRAAGFVVGAGGNLSPSFARLLAEEQEMPDWYVLEISSFQLDHVAKFRPQIAIILNITPDHLDRYQYIMDKYAQAKMQITARQVAMDWLIYNADSSNITRQLAKLPLASRRLPLHEQDSPLIELSNGWQFDLTGTSLMGSHNVFNARCALEAVSLAGATDQQALQQALHTFENAAHRLEHIGTFDGVNYINDSKATNIEATQKALHTVAAPIIWIVGGTDKGNQYEDLLPLVKQKVKAIICMGKDNSKILQAFQPLGLPMADIQSAVEAVQAAMQYAKAGDSVLLAPACASFDLFENYQDRGNQFRAAVKELHTKNLTS